MAAVTVQQRENIGVNDLGAKQKQFSPEHQKQHALKQSTEQLYAPKPDVKDLNQAQNIESGSKDKDEGDKTLNPNKIAAAVGTGAALSELSPSTSMHAISVAHAASATTALAPAAAGLSAGLLGLF